MTAPDWQHFPHGADVGVRGIGETLGQAFEQAANAMIAAIADPETIAEREEIEISCTAPDDELLLVDWLNAVIYEIGTRKMLFRKFEVSIKDRYLHAKAWGEPIDVDKHRPAIEVKGATQTELQVYRRADGAWIAQCVIDV